MKKYTIFTVLLLMIFGLVNTTYSQPWKKKNKKKFDKFIDLDWNYKSRPTIEMNYGLGTPKHKRFGRDFTNIGILELKLGYSIEDRAREKSIIDLTEHFLSVSFISSSIQSRDRLAEEISSETWRFGFSNRYSYGYKAGKVAILPYFQNGYVWSKISTDRPLNLSQDEAEVLDRYEGTFRFGAEAEGGLKIEVAQFISVNASYETSVIFPRHLFWKWAGSAVIKYIGSGTVSFFVDEIMDSSPAAVPIVNFFLQNGLAYAFYSLQRDKMNWPFNSETPLTFETFKIGFTFAF